VQRRPVHVGHVQPQLEAALLLPRAKEHGTPYLHLQGPGALRSQ
jgi:hypothetical protein